MSTPDPRSNGSSLQTSRSLISRVRAHDGEAWTRLVELYAPIVFAHCRRARLTSADAADIFQDVFGAAFTRITSFEKRKPGDTFRGWLHTITRNKVNDHFRRLKREPDAVGGTEIQRRMAQVSAPEKESRSASATGAVPGAERAELALFRVALEGIRQHFHERTWKAFHGTVVDGRSPADVGEELGMSPGAVRVAKSRVLQRLRAELGDVP